MLPAGAYAVVVVPVNTDFGELACQFGRSGQKKTPQVCVTFEVLRGPEAGQRISWFGYFTDKTADRTLESLRICGFVGEDMDRFWEQRPENEVQIIVEHEEFDGKTRAKVQWINNPGGGGVRLSDPMNQADARKFAAQFKSKLKSMPAVKGTKAEREPPGPAAEPDDRGDVPPDDSDFGRSRPASDDDIPF